MVSDGGYGNPTRLIAEAWSSMVSRIPEDFFQSKEARMEQPQYSASCQHVTYKGLDVNRLNSEDVHAIFEARWEAKNLLNQSLTAYEKFCETTGQYVRFCVAARNAKLELMHQEGRLFSLVAIPNAIETFLNYFVAHNSSTTVLKKATHLLTLADFAENYFIERGRYSERSCAGQAADFLRSVAEGQRELQKKESIPWMQKQQELASTGRLLNTRDYIELVAKAKDELRSVVRKIGQIRASYGEKGLRNFVSTDRKILKKWNINFLSLLVLTSCGQQPQTLANIKLPTHSQLRQMLRSAEVRGFFVMQVRVKADGNGLNNRVIIFPPTVFGFLEFHIMRVRPAFVGNAQTQTLPLLVHTELAVSLKGYQVSATFKAFLKDKNSEFRNISPSSVRYAFAAMAYQEFKAGNAFTSINEEEFKAHLASAMNSTPEQIGRLIPFSRNRPKRCFMNQLVSDLG